jgi:hypothetical protein
MRLMIQPAHATGPRLVGRAITNAVVENAGRRFWGWDISANIGVKLHRPGEGQDDPLYGRNGTAFCRIKEL